MVIADCTVGTGGHAEAILERIGKSGYLIGIDIDEEALRLAKQRLSAISRNFKLYHANYTQINALLRKSTFRQLDGAVFDLGVSSLQLDTPSRGFSIRHNATLDMRMDRRERLTAADIVSKYPEKALEKVFREWGQERFARRIANRIVQERKRRPITSTARLADIVQDALPYRYRFRRIHPATKIFMALRIAVNNEIENLREGIISVVPLLKPAARMCVISFHSIEDRIVKNIFREYMQRRELVIITKRPICASQDEIRNNPRSRSAKLRVAERAIPFL